MSDDFIPLNQSTPVQGRWQQKGHSQQNSYQNNWQQKNNRRRQGRHQKGWSNNSHQSNSFGVSMNIKYNFCYQFHLKF